VIAPHTIVNKGSWGGNAQDTRQFINAVFWPWMHMVCQRDSLLQRVPQRIAQLQLN